MYSPYHRPQRSSVEYMTHCNPANIIYFGPTSRFHLSADQDDPKATRMSQDRLGGMYALGGANILYSMLKAPWVLMYVSKNKSCNRG